MKPRNPEVDALFPPGSREELSRLFQAHGLTLVPHTITSVKNKKVLHLRAKRGTEVKHVATLHRFLQLSPKDREKRVKNVRASFI